MINFKDKISLQGMTFYAFHGHCESERNNGVILEVDVFLKLDLNTAMSTDDLTDTVDYRIVYSSIRKVVMVNKHALLEKVVQQILKALFVKFQQITDIQVNVRKPSPSVGGVIKYVEVSIERNRNNFFKMKKNEI